MCVDCERSMEAVVRNAKKCTCTRCRAGGFVLAVNRPVGSTTQGLSPWCVNCHHFILTGHLARGEG